MLYLSRAFVEFGPFPTQEMQGFYQRGLLKETDYIRTESTDTWVHIQDWATDLPAPEKLKSLSSPTAKAPAAKRAKRPKAVDPAA